MWHDARDVLTTSHVSKMKNPKRIILEHARWWMNHARMMGFGVWSNKKVFLVPWLWRHLDALIKMWFFDLKTSQGQQVIYIVEAESKRRRLKQNMKRRRQTAALPLPKWQRSGSGLRCQGHRCLLNGSGSGAEPGAVSSARKTLSYRCEENHSGPGSGLR